MRCRGRSNRLGVDLAFQVPGCLHSISPWIEVLKNDAFFWFFNCHGEECSAVQAVGAQTDALPIHPPQPYWTRTGVFGMMGTPATVTGPPVVTCRIPP